MGQEGAGRGGEPENPALLSSLLFEAKQGILLENDTKCLVGITVRLKWTCKIRMWKKH